MTKKHFEAVARLLKAETDRGTSASNPPEIVYRLARAFADEFAQQNPRFNRARFLQACGITNA